MSDSDPDEDNQCPQCFEDWDNCECCPVCDDWPCSCGDEEDDES